LRSPPNQQRGVGGETWGIACALHSAQNSPPRCESSLLVRGWRIRLNGVHQPVFRFSRDPEGASGGSSSRLFAFLLHWGTADEPPPKVGIGSPTTTGSSNCRALWISACSR